MADFETTHWNLIQTLGWVYLRDRQFVVRASDTVTDRGSFFQETRLPNGAIQMVSCPVDKPTILTLSLYGSSSEDICCYRNVSMASASLLEALSQGLARCWGIPNNNGNLKPIPREAWADLTFYYQPDIAGPPDLFRQGATKWHSLKFLRSDIVSLWLDPHDDAVFQQQRNGKQPANKHDWTIAETLSWLAWGETFTSDDFQLADSLSSYRSSLESSEKLRATTLEKFNLERAKIEGEPTIAEHPEIYLLATNFGHVSKQAEMFKTAIVNAEAATKKLENASGRFLYGSPMFFSQLQKAQTILFEALKSGKVEALGKVSTDQEDWQTIPPRWFWLEPAPDCVLDRGCIEREAKHSHKDWILRWLDVRFERPQVISLQNQSTVHANTPSNHDAAAPSAPTSLPSSATLSRRRAWSKAQAEKWYCDYVTEHRLKGTIPTREDDWTKAKSDFHPSITRDAVRKLREKHAPADWRRQGRRKPMKIGSDRT